MRSWEVRLVGVGRPRAVRVEDSRQTWGYDVANRTLTVDTGLEPTDRAITMAVR